LPDKCASLGKSLATAIFGKDHPITDVEIDGLTQRLRNRAKSLKRSDPSLSDELASDKAFDEISREIATDNEARLKGIKLQTYANLNRQSLYSRFKNKANGLYAITVGITGRIKGSQDSFNAQRAIEFKKLSYGKGGYLHQLKYDNKFKENLLPIARDSKNQLDIARAMAGETLEDKKLEEVGRILSESHEKARKLLNKWGANIEKQDGYINRTRHKLSKMLSYSDSFVKNQLTSLEYAREKGVILARRSGDIAGDLKSLDDKYLEKSFQHWYNFEAPLWDWDKTFEDSDISTEEKRIHRARNIHKALVSGLHEDFDPLKSLVGLDTENIYRVKGSLARKISESDRVIQYKDPASWLAHQQRMGGLTLIQSFQMDMENNARNIALLKKFGPEGVKAFEKDIDDQLRTEKGVRTRKDRFALKLVADTMNGTTSQVVSHRLATFSSYLRNFNSLTLLGSSITSAFSDVANDIANMRFNGKGVLESELTGLKDFLSTPSMLRSDVKKNADIFSTSSRGYIGSTSSRFGLADRTGGNAGIMGSYFYMNILHPWDEAKTGGVAMRWARELALNKGTKFNNLSEEMRNSLFISGIDAPEWDLIRFNPMRLDDGRHYIGGNSVQNATIDQVKDYLKSTETGQRVTNDIAQDTKDRVQDLLSKWFFTQEQSVVPLPGLREQVKSTGGLPKGTLLGEGIRDISQFRSFPDAFFERIIKRNMFSHPKPGIMPFMTSMTELGVNLLLFEMVRQTANAFLVNKTPPDFKDPAMMIDALKPMLGAWTFYFSAQNMKYGHSPFSGLFGPTGELGENVVNLFTQSHKGLHLAKLLNKSIPLSNFWATKGLWKALVYNQIAEYMDPGITSRSNHRLEQLTGQTPLFGG